MEAREEDVKYQCVFCKVRLSFDRKGEPGRSAYPVATGRCCRACYVNEVIAHHMGF